MKSAVQDLHFLKRIFSVQLARSLSYPCRLIDFVTVNMDTVADIFYVNNFIQINKGASMRFYYLCIDNQQRLRQAFASIFLTVLP